MLGPGYLEAVYEEALAVELTARSVPFQRQVPVPVAYKGHNVGASRLDFLIDEVLVVELKAVDLFHPIHMAQVLSYLKATGNELGLLLNFNVPLMRSGIKRVMVS